MRKLQTIVLENSRTCNLKCRDCPTVYCNDYPAGFMTMSTFERILEHVSPEIFPQCGLTGWGETFLDPHYFAKLKELKRRGYYVGSTTNFTLVDPELVAKALDHGLDLLCISIDSFHLQASQMELESLPKRLSRCLGPVIKSSSSLTIGINIVVSRKTRGLVFNLLKMLDALPISHVSMIPLIMIPTEELQDELLNARELLEIRSDLNKLPLNFRIDYGYLEKPPYGNCRSDIFNNAYVSYNGLVSPCCTLAMVFPNYGFDRRRYETTLVHFGDLAREDFTRIWHSAGYEKFRKSFVSGTVPSECLCCNAWRRLPVGDE